MKRVGRKLIWSLFAVSAVQAAHADAGHPDKAAYDKIAQRNVFGLVSSSGGEPINSAEPTRPAEVKLTGITTVLGQKRAFFIVHSPPESGKAKEESYMLTVGQRQAGYQLLDVDEKAGTARLKADSRVLVLNLPSPKLPTASAAPALAQTPGARPFPVRIIGHPAAEVPPLPPVPGVPESGSNADPQPDADLAGRP